MLQNYGKIDFGGFASISRCSYIYETERCELVLPLFISQHISILARETYELMRIKCLSISRGMYWDFLVENMPNRRV